MTRTDDPTTWPLAVLPLVRRTAGGSWPETGLLLPGGGPVVYLTDAFTPGPHRRLASCDRETHPTFADVAAAGWVVDQLPRTFSHPRLP